MSVASAGRYQSLRIDSRAGTVRLRFALCRTRGD
jgi:hypothetical protein